MKQDIQSGYCGLCRKREEDGDKNQMGKKEEIDGKMKEWNDRVSLGLEWLEERREEECN